MQTLLSLRKQIKSRKPNFVRQDFQLKKLKSKWRRPKGMHSKLRLNKAGHIKRPSPGYGSPKKVKNLHPKGFKIRRIKNVNELNNIRNDESLLLSSKLGLKKKLEILKKVQEQQIKVLNIRDIEDFLKKNKEKFEKKKQEKHKKEEEKKKSKEKAVEEAEKKKQEEKTEEEKKQEEEKTERGLTRKLMEKTAKQKPGPKQQTKIQRKVSAPKQK